MSRKTNRKHTTKTKAYIGAFVNPDLKNRLQEISRAEHRSLNSQVAIFLAEGVAHREQKAA